MPRTNNPNGRPKTAPNAEKRTDRVTVAFAPTEADILDTRRGTTPRAEHIRRVVLAEPPARGGEEE